MAQKHFRRKYLIYKKFQLTVIFFHVGLASLAILILFLENQLLFSKFTGADIPELMTDPLVVEIMKQEQAHMQGVFAITAAAILLALAFGGLILSHRVAGPIYRLQKHMKETMSGETRDDVKFRKKDFFQELAGTYNSLLGHFRGKTSG